MTPDNMSAAMWLHMLKHGGRWTATELSRFTHDNRDRADTMLNAMARRGIVSSYISGKRKNGRAYGVHLGCRFPRGVTLEQVLQAAGVGTGQAPAEPIEEIKDKPMPSTTTPRGQLAHVGRVSSIFAMAGSTRTAA